MWWDNGVSQCYKDWIIFFTREIFFESLLRVTWGVRGDCQNVHPEVSRHVCWYHLTHQLPLNIVKEGRRKQQTSMVTFKYKTWWFAAKTQDRIQLWNKSYVNRGEKLSFIWKVVKSDITSSERIKLFHYLSLGCCERAAHMLQGTVGNSGGLEC